MARVGVTLSSYNRPAGLLAAIDSVCDQSHQDWALAVADDHSEDPEVLRVLDQAQKDPRITVLRGPKVDPEVKRSKVCTFGALINEAVARLRLLGCDLFAYLVDDVVYHRDRLRAHVDLLEARPDVFLVWGEQWLVVLDDAGRVVSERRQVPEHGMGDRSMAYVRQRLWSNSFINHCSATHRATTARWSTRPAHWQNLDQVHWLEVLRQHPGAVFYHVPDVGETMTSTPKDIGPMLQARKTIADVARARGGS